MSPESTVLDLKQRIKTIYPHIDVEAQTFEFDEQKLQDSRSLESYDIGDHSVLDLRLSTLRSQSSKFFVQILSSRDFQMEVKSSMLVRDLKQSIAEILRVSTKQFDLFHKNDVKGIHDKMSEDDILAHYNLDEDSAILAWD
ncbi:hypothetical protein M5689_015793 [Euphorbia peplus]|nr:hypothetical protein M5689_015793 [Euphorbia peplus]